MTRRAIPVLLLVAVNLVPLFGVLLFGWSLFSILVLYWVENGIVGFFNVFKIWLARRPVSDGTGFTVNGRPAGAWGKAFLVPFFVFHYGIFWVVHGVFVILAFGVFGGMLFGAREVEPFVGFRDFDERGVAIAVAALFLSHGVSFVVNFLGRREYEEVSPDEQMAQPYSRVVVLHLTILGGGFLAAYLGAPLASLVVMVLLKIGLDLRAHLREHREETPAPTTASG